MSDDRRNEGHAPSPRSGLTTAVCLSLTVAAALLAACGGSDPPNNGGVIQGQMAAAKFCHELHRSGQPIALRVEIGSPPIVTMTATTNTCTPILGSPCTSIPVGKNIPVRLFEGDKLIAATVLNLQQNLEYFFVAVVSSAGQPAIRPLIFKPEFKCATTDPLEKPDGGSSDAGSADGGVPADGGSSSEAGSPDAGVADSATTTDGPLPADASSAPLDALSSPDTAAASDVSFSSDAPADTVAAISD